MVTKNYFPEHETACKCGCGKNNMDYDFVHRLNIAREIAGVPFVITSGFRCPDHNKEVGGVVDSAHMIGKAVDISVKDESERFKILEGLIKAGFKRIGERDDFIHVDEDKRKKYPAKWNYNC